MKNIKAMIDTFLVVISLHYRFYFSCHYFALLCNRFYIRKTYIDILLWASDSSFFKHVYFTAAEVLNASFTKIAGKLGVVFPYLDLRSKICSWFPSTSWNR